MGKLSKVMGFPSLGEAADPMDDGDGMDAETPKDDSSEAPGTGKAEVLAMKQFERAKTPQEKAQAMYDFMQACGVC